MPEEWDDEPSEEQPRDWAPVKRAAAAGVGLTVAVVAWLISSRPSDERLSMAGFSVGAGGPVAPASKALFERRSGTGLDQVYVGAMGEAPSAEALSGGEPAAAPASSGVAHAAEIPPPAPAPESKPVASPPLPGSGAPDDAKELAAVGVPTSAGGLTDLGAKPGLLSSLAAKMLDHPKVLRAVFDNKLVVDAFMSRDVSRRNCGSGSELKNYLSDPGSAGMRTVFPVLQQALGKPSSAAALAGTEMASRLMDCPSVKQLTEDPTAFAEIAATNPKALSLVTDPRAMSALSGNSRALAMLSSATSAAGGAKP